MGNYGVIIAIFGLSFVCVKFFLHLLLGDGANAKEEDKTDKNTSNSSHWINDEQTRAWWDVLDLPSSASESDIRTAYRSKISKYHPDKFASLAKGFSELAEIETKILNDAYQNALNTFKK